MHSISKCRNGSDKKDCITSITSCGKPSEMLGRGESVMNGTGPYVMKPSMKDEMEKGKTEMKKHIRRIIIVSAIILSAALPGLKKLQPLEQKGVKLTKCTDGDTAHFMIDGQDTTVRFLAIDTPETKKPNTPVQPYGKEASRYTCDALSSAKEIRLEYEKEKTDMYGRNLAWVFVDDKLLQEQLIRKGYAKVAYLYDEYTYTDRLQKAEKEAKAQELGLWDKE